MNEWLDYSEFIEKAQELIDLGLHDEAKSLLDQYSSAFAGEWEPYFLYSRIFADQNRPLDVIPCLHKGLQLEPVNVDCLVGLFYAYAMMNRMDQAGRYLLRAEKYHPDNELVLSALIWFHSETGSLPRAISYFERLRSSGTTNPETLRNAGVAYDRAGQSDKAIECFTRALEMHPADDEVRELLSELLISLGKADEALALYHQALAISPNNIRHRSRIVYVLSRNNQTDKAAETARETILLYPNSPIGYIDLAYVYLNTGEPGKAMEEAERAQSVAPLDAEGFRVKAIIYSDKGEDALAEEAFTAAIGLDRNNPEILRDYYTHLRKTGRYPEMEEVVSRVITLEGGASVEDYWFLADFHREQKDDLKAMHYLHLGFRMRPGEYDLLPPIIDILIEHGHKRFAMRFLRFYARQTGWNEMMDHFAHHPQLQNRTAQEELRFLRYTYGNKAAFDRYLFGYYFRKALRYSLAIIFAVASFPVYVLFGKTGLACLAGLAVIILGGIIFAIHRKRAHAFNNFEQDIS
ncbi:MAG: tetratricopeptide repeat protein [Chitinispirillaceae bacterium]|nr:tetratricopeptide repeat protein [Chitinispirillaceae bacterium]